MSKLRVKQGGALVRSKLEQGEEGDMHMYRICAEENSTPAAFEICAGGSGHINSSTSEVYFRIGPDRF